jgi:hypothetical protein
VERYLTARVAGLLWTCLPASPTRQRYRPESEGREERRKREPSGRTSNPGEEDEIGMESRVHVTEDTGDVRQ